MHVKKMAKTERKRNISKKSVVDKYYWQTNNFRHIDDNN